jgi:cell division protein FtsZ
MAVSSPLLEASIEGARGVLLSIAGGSDLGLFEINEAAGLVADAVHPEAKIIFGAVIDDALGDEVRVTVIAAGFDGGEPKSRDSARPALFRDAEAENPASLPDQGYPSPSPVLDGVRPVTVPPEPLPTEYGDDLDIPDFLR